LSPIFPFGTSIPLRPKANKTNVLQHAGLICSSNAQRCMLLLGACQRPHRRPSLIPNISRHQVCLACRPHRRAVRTATKGSSLLLLKFTVQFPQQTGLRLCRLVADLANRVAHSAIVQTHPNADFS
jgi:hypothetical protein